MNVVKRISVTAVLAVLIHSTAADLSAQQPPLFGCVKPGTGLLRIPSAGESCKSEETPLTFNDFPLLVALKNQVTALQTALAAETAARVAANAALQGGLNAETAARLAADQALRSAFCAEIDRLPG